MANVLDVNSEDIRNWIREGRQDGYPDCCILYFIECQANPDLERWMGEPHVRMLCPSCAKDQPSLKVETIRQVYEPLAYAFRIAPDWYDSVMV